MKKRFFVLFFAVFLMLLTAGCSGDPDDSTGNDKPTGNTAVKPSNTPKNSTALPVTAGGDVDLDMTIVFPESLKNTDSAKIIASKEDLTACIKNSIKRYYRFFADLEDESSARSVSAGSSSVRAASASDMKTKLHKIIDDDILNAFDGIDDFLCERITPVDFDNSIDFADVSIKNGVDALVDFTNYFNQKESGRDQDKTVEDLFGSNAQNVINVIDKYASFPKLAANLKIKINEDTKVPDNSNIVLDAGCTVNAEVHDIDSLIKDSLAEWNNCNPSDPVKIPSSIDLPVKSVSVGLTWSVIGDVTQAQWKIWQDRDIPWREWDDSYWNGTDYIYRDRETIEAYKQRLDDWLKNNDFAANKCSAELGFAVSVAAAPDGNVPGGIITASFAKSYTDAKSLLRDFVLFDQNSGGDDELLYVLKEIDGGTCTKLTVSDFSGNQKFSLGSGQNVIGEIEDIAEDIEQNIGELIQ